MMAVPVGRAAVFSSSDNMFTLDMPAGWRPASRPLARSVLSLEKPPARLDVKPFSCSNKSCIEKQINKELKELERKHLQTSSGTYGDENIKRLSLEGGATLLYLSFTDNNVDSSSGYFLIQNKAYHITSQDLTDAETELIFSFLLPASNEEPPSHPQAMELNLADSRAYEIDALPDVAQVTIEAPVAPTPTEEIGEPSVLEEEENNLTTPSSNTLVSPRMPRYIRWLGRWFDTFVVLGLLFLLFVCGALVIRGFVHGKPNLPPANPHSLYPIRISRLYGTPSVIFRAKDNQGHILTSLADRWDSILFSAGIVIITGTCFLLALTGLLDNSQAIRLPGWLYTIMYGAGSFFLPLGVVVLIGGAIWSQVTLREIVLFDNKGQEAACILQIRAGFQQERYDIYFSRSREVLTATRQRFTRYHTWQLRNAQGHILADVQERHGKRSFLRHLFGHLWGFFRADYTIRGPMDSTGVLLNDHAFFNCSTCQLDKPQAISARDMLVLSLLINVRDRDKWYPWFC